MVSTASRPNSTDSRPLGSLIVGVLVGACLAYALAQDLPVAMTGRQTRREMAVTVAERAVVFVVAGSIVGALLGWWLERRPGAAESFRRVAVCLLLIYVIASGLVRDILPLLPSIRDG